MALCLAAGLLAVALSGAADLAEPPAETKGHPLDAAIRWAEGAQKQAEQIKDYTGMLVKRERVGEQLQDYQFIDLKIRHEPFSVYLKFVKPAHVSGREIIYVDGRNDGMLLAHDARGVGDLLGTVALAPDGLIAMRGQRYPVTMIGIKNLGQRLIDHAKRDRDIDAKCDVKWFHAAKVDGRPARCIQVTHTVRHPEHSFVMARVYIDDELGIPIRYEGYGWPEAPQTKPVLMEEYTYTGLRLDVGLTDKDFDPRNPAYSFP